MNSKGFDLNSLLILNAVIECRSVTAAAKKMVISPSSVTYAINKIRRMTSNPIFTRSKNGITPTTLALELNERYVKAISLINDGLDLSTSTEQPEIYRNITVSTYTFFELWLSCYVNNNENFPDTLCLNFVKHIVSKEMRISKIRNHEVDFDIGGLLPNDASIISHKLCSSRFKLMVRNDHPTIRDQFTLDDWNNSKHVKWMQMPDEALVNDGNAGMIEELQNRNVSLKSASTLNLLLICTLSDYVMLVPEYMEEFMCKTFPVRFFELPFETTMTSSLYVHFHRSAKRKDFVGSFLDVLVNMLPDRKKDMSEEHSM